MIIAVLVLSSAAVLFALVAATFAILGWFTNRRASKSVRELDEGVGRLASAVAESLESAFSPSAIAERMAAMDEQQLRALADEIRVIRKQRQ